MRLKSAGNERPPADDEPTSKNACTYDNTTRSTHCCFYFTCNVCVYQLGSRCHAVEQRQIGCATGWKIRRQRSSRRTRHVRPVPRCVVGEVGIADILDDFAMRHVGGGGGRRRGHGKRWEVWSNEKRRNEAPKTPPGTKQNISQSVNQPVNQSINPRNKCTHTHTENPKHDRERE